MVDPNLAMFCFTFETNPEMVTENLLQGRYIYFDAFYKGKNWYISNYRQNTCMVSV